MEVSQVDKKNATKDGRRWLFYTYIYDTLGNRKKYATKQKAINAERDYLSKINRKEINISDMTFKDLYEEFYEYKQDKVKLTTLRTYRVNIVPMKVFDDLKIQDFTV